MSEKWFWAWLRLKKREEVGIVPTELTDQAFLGAVISAIIAKSAPAGDGKFSRIDNYVKDVRTEIEWCRRNWVGSDEILTAFFMGVEAMCTEFEHVTEMIKKGH